MHAFRTLLFALTAACALQSTAAVMLLDPSASTDVVSAGRSAAVWPASANRPGVDFAALPPAASTDAATPVSAVESASANRPAGLPAATCAGRAAALPPAAATGAADTAARVARSGALVGMTDTAAYFPLLAGRRVALLANHTSVATFETPVAGTVVGENVHLADLLHARGFEVTGIFSPEHGFRGTADAGERVADATDARTGIPIRSLYDGSARRPSAEAMRSFDVLLVDMQDVGLRFYTYYITMLRMMEACADFDRQVIVLDRPNPNGRHVDGPVLDMRFASGVGALPIPVLHGLTMGEIARMSVGEGWVRPCDLEVVPCRNYTRTAPYALPVAPSPNLPTQRAVYLYASLCLFEGTVVSLGRGTERPFEVYGHPDMTGCTFSFTPRPTPGAKHPPLEGVCCRGVDLSGMPLDRAREVGFSLEYVIAACRNLGLGDGFFTPMFEKLVGTDYVRRMILEGFDEQAIRARWLPEVARFRAQRTPYLLYAE